MSIRRKSKIYYYIILPSIIALAVIASILVWVNGVKNTIWVVSICWSLAAIISSVLFIMNTKIVKDNESTDSILDQEKDASSKSKMEDDHTLQI